MYEYGLGWSDVPANPPCPQVTDGTQKCFLPDEEKFAVAQGCATHGALCTTTDGNRGTVFCCPPGWPRPPGATTPEGVKPPLSPDASLLQAFQNRMDAWWFWPGVFGALGMVGLLVARTIIK